MTRTTAEEAVWSSARALYAPSVSWFAVEWFGQARASRPVRMRQEWWVPIVQWSLWGIVVAGVMGWVARSRLRARPPSQLRTLRHPPSTLVLGTLGALFFFGIAVASNTVGENASTTIWTTLVFVSLGLLSVPMIIDYFFARHAVSESGIEYGRMFGARGTLRWSEVRRVRFAPNMKWFVLERQSGRPVRISAMLMGLPEFAQLLLRHVPRERIDAAALPVIEATSEGHAPSVWG